MRAYSLCYERPACLVRQQIMTFLENAIGVTTKSLAAGLFLNRLKKNGRSTRARGASIIAARLKI